MVKELDFTKHSVKDFWVGLKGMFLEEMTERSRGLLKELLEGTLEWELREYAQLNQYEREEKRKDCRNGHRSRGLMTTWGSIEEIRVPRSPCGGFQPRTFERYKMVGPRANEGGVESLLWQEWVQELHNVTKNCRSTSPKAVARLLLGMARHSCLVPMLHELDVPVCKQNVVASRMWA